MHNVQGIMTTENLIILGSGPAGLTAAIYAARLGLEPLLVTGGVPGGQLMGTTLVENWPGEKSILGPSLMHNFFGQAEALGTRFVHATAIAARLSCTPFEVCTDNGQQLQAHTLVIATGALPRRLNCPGEAEYWGKGVSTCALCDGALYKGRPVIVVGGGNSAVEHASFLTRFTDAITIVQSLPQLTATDKRLLDAVLQNPKISILYESTVTAVTGNKEQVTGATITHLPTQKTRTIATDALFIAIGLTPNSSFTRPQLELAPTGHIVVKMGPQTSTQTSMPGVFAAGDVVDNTYRQAITAAASGCMAALDAQNYLKKINLLLN